MNEFTPQKNRPGFAPFVLALLMLVQACSRVAGDLSLTPPPTPTAAPSATPVPPPTVTAIPTAATARVTTLGAVTPGPTATANPNQKMQSLKMTLIATNDNGRAGRKVGCGDSAVQVDVDVPVSDRPIGAVLAKLFEIRGSTYGSTGLYNALGASNLRVTATDNINGKVVVKLVGQVVVVGTCDAPRMVAQIQDTVAQFSWSKNAIITVNGAPLESLGSGR